MALPRIGTPKRRLFGRCAMPHSLVAVGGIGVQNQVALCGVEPFLHTEQRWPALPDMTSPTILFAQRDVCVPVAAVTI